MANDRNRERMTTQQQTSGQLKLQRCHIRECGAVVGVIPVSGGEIAVDPRPIEFVVQEPDTLGRIVTGYRPHWVSCVDIVARSRHAST